MIVYKIECLVNRRVYIGCTKRKFKQRCNEHKNLLRQNKHYNSYLQEDYNKYGLNSFTFSQIDFCTTRLQALQQETYWIKYYGGINSMSTYNMQDNTTKNYEYSLKISNSKKGGTAWNKGRKMTETEIEKNRLSHIGIKRSLASREKQKQSIKQNPNFGNKGKHLSETTKLKISNSKKGGTAWNKGRRNDKHKYDNILSQLQQEYKELGNYKAVHRLHPNMCYDTVYRLIKYGYTYTKLNKV